MADVYLPEGFFVTTLSAAINSSTTTIPLTAVPSTVTKGYMIIEPSHATLREVIHFTSVGASSVTTTNDTTDSGDATGRGCKGSITVGANTAHDQGVTVIIAASYNYWKRFYDKLTGNDATVLVDTNGNEILKVAQVASAVNEITLTNGATGNAPIASVTGDDTNIDFYLKGKGSGLVKVWNGSSYVETTSIISTTLYPNRGFLINGKIVPSVSSNNLTVALKGIDGNDPSASNPVYIRIGDTVRTITSALSVTKNAGTNWFASGGTEFATRERDYFVYLGYNATDGVVIGFSPICHAKEYDDFSATTTNEQYAAISNITTAASGDDYELIGRFPATLSAGSGYTWTVPSFTNKNLINQPIFETRWLKWTPSYTGFSAVPTELQEYRLVNNTVFCKIAGTGTSNSATFDLTIPFTAAIQITGATFLTSTGIFDNSAWSSTFGVIGIAVGGSASRTIKVGKDFTTAAANAFGGFTTSGSKGAFGEFFYSI